MSNAKLSGLFLAVSLLGAAAAQAAGPTSVSEVPPAWYADRIVTIAPTSGATAETFPATAQEHGPAGRDYAQPSLTRPSVARSTPGFPASPNETGSL